MFLKELEFRQGLCFLGNTQVYVCPLNYFLTVINFYFDSYNDDEMVKLFRGVSSIDSKILYDQLHLKTSNEKFLINKFLDKANLLGFGELKLKSFVDMKLIFTQDNPHLSRAYETIFGKKPKVLIENFFAGFIENILSNLFKKKVLVEIQSFSNSLTYIAKITDEVFDFDIEKTYEEVGKSELSPVVKKIVLGGGVDVTNGVFTMSGMAGVLIPYFLFIEFSKFLDVKKGLIFEKELAFMQGKAGIDMHRYFGAKTGEDCLNGVLGLLDVSGMGKAGLVEEGRYDKLFLKNNLNSHFSKFYSKEEILRVNYHFFYMFEGCYDFAFNKTTELEILSDTEFCFNEISDGRELNDYEKNISKSLTTKVLITNKP